MWNEHTLLFTAWLGTGVVGLIAGIIGVSVTKLRFSVTTTLLRSQRGIAS